MKSLNEFDVLLDDVLHSMANPEIPAHVTVHTRVWVQDGIEAMSHDRAPGRPQSIVFAPEDFLARMQPKRDARSTGLALLAHVAAIALVVWISASQIGLTKPKDTAVAVTEVSVPPPVAPAKMLMGGGGGQRGATPVTQGRLPKFAEQQITPPKAPPMEQPKIHMPEPTIEVQKDLKMADSNLPNFGMPDSTLSGNSMGNGSGTGIGSGHGSGLGAGVGGNFGGGLRKIGGGVSRPVAIYTPQPEFSEEARRTKSMGVVTVTLVVDANGVPQEVHVLRGVGMGLDEKVIAAVQQWRFKPAMENGKPVPVQMNVVVDFQIF